MNRLNNIWSLNPNQTNMFNPQQAQLMLLQQQLQQHMAQQEAREAPKFNSSFSVNNLLGTRPAPQQQIAAVLTQQLAAAMVNNYRQQMSKFQRPVYPDSAFHQPNKRLKTNDFDQSDNNQLNTSTSSISSPSSSSSSTTSALLDYSHLNQPHLNESDFANNSSNLHENISERNTPDLLSYSSSSSSSCSFSIKRSNENSIYSNGSTMQCPICGLDMSSLSELRAHFNQELNEIVKCDEQIVSNEKRALYLNKNSRYLKFEEIKENRMKRSMKKSIQRLNKNLKENFDTCKTNQKTIRKREFDEIDCELSTGIKQSKRSRLETTTTTTNPDSELDEVEEDELTNNVEENEEYINVVDNDDDGENNLIDQHDKHFNDSDLDAQENNLSNSKCTNCLQIFNNNALVSVTCWHVNCKSCWLKSINENKNCPQCCTMTLPKHLKKIML